MSRHENVMIKKFVEQLKRDLLSIRQHNSAIIFTGLTGSGKGTLIHFLMKNSRLFAQMSETGDMIISLKKNFNGKIDEITISSKMASDTSIPHEIKFRDQIYRDLPGFMDNRDQEKFIPQDIINSFFIHEVYQKTKNIKIVFTTSKNSLTDKATEFIKSLNHFAQRFEDITEIMRSVFLVVTKVPPHLELKHIKFILGNILKDLKNQIPQKSRLLLQQWQSKQQLIQLFKIPQNLGPLNFAQSTAIYQKLKSLPYSPSPSINNIISEHSQSQLIQLQQKWNESISQICYELIKANYELYLKKIQKIKMLNTAKSSLNFFRHKLDQLMGADSPSEFKFRIKKIPQLYKQKQTSLSQVLMKQFDEYFDFLSMFSKIHPNIHSILKWKEPLYKIHHTISQLVSQPWQQIHDQDIYIKGFVVESSTIQKKIHHQKLKFSPVSSQHKGKVVIFAYFFIMNEDIEYYGGNMMIYTQYFIIEENSGFLKIRLNGENAKDYSVLTDDDDKDGQPGRPGQNGGNLLLKVYEKCLNLQKFSVDLRGGRGGKGKNGGQIKKQKAKNKYINQILADKELKTNEKMFLMYRQDYKFSQRNIFSKMGEVLRILSTYNGQIVEFYSTEVILQKSLEDFNYTLGGAGGKPGHSGNIHVDVGAQTVNVISQPEESNNGEGHVQVYEGLYVKEMIFPNFREQGMEINYKVMAEQKQKELEFNMVKESMDMRREKKIERDNKKLERKKSFLNAEEIRELVEEAKKEEEEELKTPIIYKTKYKEETEYFDDDFTIKEEENEEDDVESEKSRSRRVGKQQKIESDQKIPEPNPTPLRRGKTGEFQMNHFLKRKPDPKSTFYLSQARIDQPSQSQYNPSNASSYMKSSKRSTKTLQSDRFERIRPSNPLIISKRRSDAELSTLSKQSDTKIDKKVIIDNVGKVGKEVVSQVATDLGTGAFEKFAQRVMNKVCQKIVRSGITMEKQVLRQIVEDSLKSQAEKKLLANLGILTGQNLSLEIAKAAALKAEQSIITNLGKEIFRDTAGIFQRQALKKLAQDAAKQSLKRIGHQAARQAQIHLAAKSLSSGTVYMQGMLSGLAKSIVFQIFLSALMSSGVTDGWIIKPHFKSKKLDLKIYNYEGIQEPQPYEDFTVEEMEATQKQYNFFNASFKQFKDVFADKI